MSKRPGALNWAIILGGAISAVALVLLCAGLVTMLRGGLPVSSDESEGSMPHLIVRPQGDGGDGGDSGDGGSGAPTEHEGGVGADDGELHSALNTDVSYTITTDHYRRDKTEQVEAYGKKVYCHFEVSYPQVSDDVAQAKRINRLLRRTACESVNTYYREPSANTVERVMSVVDEDEDAANGLPDNAEMLLESTVDYAVTYNSEDLLSVCFADEYYMGTYAAGFVALRTVNVNLKTGEVYELADVLTVDDEIARSFVDNLVQESGEDANGDGVIDDSECFTIGLCGREAFEQGICGEGELAGPRVITCLFIDGNGQPNLGVTYWISGRSGFVRGWWDVTVTDEQLSAARKESSLWDALGK